MPSSATLANDVSENLPGESRDTSPGRRLHVCHLSMTLETGGLERLLVDYSRFHNSQKFKLSFVALEGIGFPGDELREAGYHVEEVRLADLGKVGGFKRLARLLADEKVDILHTHNTYPHFYGTIAAKWSQIPLVINTQHGRGCGPNRKSLWQFRIANQLTDCIVGVSEDATQLCRQQNPSSSDKIRCIWNGIDLERFQFTGPKQELHAIAVGRLSPEKDFATLIRAMKIVVPSYPEFKLSIVGNGPLKEDLITLASELDLLSNIKFLGERSDVSELLSTAGFFVSSSKTEGISLTLLEAMAVGLPVVATAVGGTPEIVLPNHNGQLVPSEDPGALAVGMEEMLEARALWPNFGEAGRARVEQDFNIRTMIGRYEDLYLSLFNEVSES